MSIVLYLWNQFEKNHINQPGETTELLLYLNTNSLKQKTREICCKKTKQNCEKLNLKPFNYVVCNYYQYFF